MCLLAKSVVGMKPPSTSTFPPSPFRKTISISICIDTICALASLQLVRMRSLRAPQVGHWTESGRASTGRSQAPFSTDWGACCVCGLGLFMVCSSLIFILLLLLSLLFLCTVIYQTELDRELVNTYWIVFFSYLFPFGVVNWLRCFCFLLSLLSLFRWHLYT